MPEKKFFQQVVEKVLDDAILCPFDKLRAGAAKDLLYSRAIGNNSRFFSPPKAGGFRMTPRGNFSTTFPVLSF